MEERTKSASKDDELRLLDGLDTDFSYLHRFILAAHQMVRILNSELARSDFDVQEKLVSTIEIAKETLSEAGVSARSFVRCPPSLVQHRGAYFDMLCVARDLVPYVKDAEVRRYYKVRLRRLLLPLSSTSRFRVRSASEMSNGKDHAAPLTCWDVPAASSSGIGQQSVVSIAHNSPSKKMKLTSPGAQRYSHGTRATSPTPSTSTPQQLHSRTPTNASLVTQRGRASPISSDVSQRRLVKRATQTVMSRSSTPSPIRISSPLPVLSSSLSSSPSPSPSPSPPPSLAAPSSPTGPPTSDILPPSTSFGWHTLPPKPESWKNLGPGYEAFKKSGESIDWDWYVRDRMDASRQDNDIVWDIPSHVILGGSWADAPLASESGWEKLVSRPYTGPGVAGSSISWVLEDTAPKPEKKEETLADSTCTVM